MKNVNEKNSVAQVAVKVRSLEKKYRNVDRSSNAPAISQRDIGAAQPQLKGRRLTSQQLQTPQSLYQPSIPIPRLLPDPTPSQALPRPPTLHDALHNPIWNASSSLEDLVPAPLSPPLDTAASDSSSLKRKQSAIDEGNNKSRKSRTCRKCCLPDCKGSSRVEYCANPCQDCHQVECRGRNSRHPHKDCVEGWKLSVSKKLKS